MTSPVTVVRRRITVQGVVQGVGFRPYLVRLVQELGLSGECRNDTTCVIVEVEGPAADLDALERRIPAEAPPLARITAIAATELPGRASNGGRPACGSLPPPPAQAPARWSRPTRRLASTACASSPTPPIDDTGIRSSPAPTAGLG